MRQLGRKGASERFLIHACPVDMMGHWLFLFMETGESPVRLRKGTFRRFFLLEMEKEAGKGGKSPCHIVEKGGKHS